jgi:hypothetical protein
MRAMPLEVRLSEPPLLDELIRTLSRYGCIAHRSGEATCRVVHVHATHAQEAEIEVGLFMRAWMLAHPGVSAVVSG